MTSRYAAIAALLLATASPHAFAQQAPAAPHPAEAPHSESEPPEKGLKSRVFELKHRDPRSLRSILKTLGSGARGSVVDVTAELRTIAVRDFPENLAAMEDALKRLDRPGVSVPDVELRIHVLSTSRSAEPDQDIPPELKETIAALKATLSYRSYRLLTTLDQRAADGTRAVRTGGVVSVDGTPQRDVQAEFVVTQVSIVDAGQSPATVRLDGLRFVLAGDGKAEIATDVTLREGEQVVVGTSTYRGRGVVLVVSAKVVR